ncbi:hypothetical protein [Legionella rowbothamii]|uniref:hypothetical protein n=1 Tax=Legionella rowbothamii TaxID=96229 RepID=UPI0010549B39|nr:hypothetical protein [Legionella rowbothamii]
MLSKAQLLQFIDECQKLPLILSPALTEKEIYWMRLETTVGFDFFKNLAKQFNFETELEDVNELIRRYLTERGASLGEKSSIAYLNHPFLPINQLCLKVAEAIAHPDESIWTILMPSVDKLCRPLMFSFKEDTEDDGHFPLEYYALDQTQTKLIPIAEIFNSAEANTNALFPDFQENSTMLRYKLGGRDFLTLEQIGGEATLRYMRALRQSHNRQFDDQSIGFAIRKLVQDLKRGAVGDAGTEFVADNEVLAAPIHSFYALWRSLPENIKAQVAPLTLQHYGYANVSLECYFLTLFARCLGCALTEEESQRQHEADILPCAQQISESLDEYLTQHKQLYAIKINGQDTEVQALPDLKRLRDEALGALKIRGQHLGQDDSDLWSHVAVLLTFSGYSTLTIAQIIAPEVQHMDDLLPLILISPKLFAAVVGCIHPRLGLLEFDVQHIHEVLRYFSAENQQIIIQARSEELKKFICENPEYYFVIYKVLRPTIQASFDQSYLNCLSDEIQSGKQCVFLLSKLNPNQLASMLTYLQPRLSGIFKDFDFAQFLIYRAEGHHQLMIDALFELLNQWFNPNTYLRWEQSWDRASKTYFLNRYFEERKVGTSFSALLKFLQQWEGKCLIHESILEYCKAPLKIWVSDSEHLSIFLHHLEYPSKILGEFAHLINHKELFCHWLKFLPITSRLQAISAVNFSTFIHSFAVLQEITPNLNKEECSVVLKQLVGHSCLSDSNELVELRSTKTSYFIGALENYASQCSDQGRLEVANNLLKKLHNPKTPLAELIERFQQARKKIDTEYSTGPFLFFSSSVNSRLHTILKRAEQELQELLDLSMIFDPVGAIEQLKKWEFPERISLFIERLKRHRVEHEFTSKWVDDLIEQLSSDPERASDELVKLLESVQERIVSRTKTIGLISSFVESSAKNDSLYLLLNQFIKEIKESSSLNMDEAKQNNI